MYLSLAKSKFRYFVSLLGFFCMVLMPLDAVYILRQTVIADNGAVVFAGNTLGLGKQVDQNQPGTSDAIGAFITTDTTLQVGNFPAGTTLDWTKNNSKAVLDVPPGSTVIYAELIWSGSYGYFNEGGNQGQDPNIILTPANGAIIFTTPDNVQHSIVPDPTTSQNVQNPTVPYSAGNYVRSAQVTAFVQANGGGVYAAGGIPSTISALDNTHNAAGWTLAVIYRNPTMLTNNMSIFVGCEQASYTTNMPAVVQGFCTPPEGALSGRLLVSAIEGDATKTGDHMTFGPTSTTLTQLSGPNNPISNFFCSQINNSQGLLDTRGSFGNLNQIPNPPSNVNAGRQGYDITNVDVSSTLTHNQQQGFALGTTTLDDYTINALGLQIQVAAPIITMSKTVNGAISVMSRVGDTVTFAVVLQNTGTVTAHSVLFVDQLQTGLTYVSNSFTINGSPVASPDLNNGVPLGDFPPFGPPVTVVFKALISSPVSGDIYYNSANADYTFIPCQSQTPIDLTAQSNVVTIFIRPPCPCNGS
ncbi:MAG: DUF11 domain-containing protein [Parachlamydia sp.]|nr:DUF11 domain-containing protein [Parachlamydia sp.]